MPKNDETAKGCGSATAAPWPAGWEAACAVQRPAVLCHSVGGAGPIPNRLACHASHAPQPGPLHWHTERFRPNGIPTREAPTTAVRPLARRLGDFGALRWRLLRYVRDRQRRAPVVGGLRGCGLVGSDLHLGRCPYAEGTSPALRRWIHRRQRHHVLVRLRCWDSLRPCCESLRWLVRTAHDFVGHHVLEYGRPSSHHRRRPCLVASRGDRTGIAGTG